MAKSFAETHPHNPNATCECEHWQSCIDCHPTAHGEKYMTDAMRVRQAVAQAVLQEPVEYQYRTRPDWIPEWNEWNTCSKESAEAYEKNPYLYNWHYEVRRLYTTPPQHALMAEHWKAEYDKLKAACKPLTDEMIVAGGKALAKLHAESCGLDFDDVWKYYAEDHKADAKAAIEAAHGIKE